MAWLSNGILEGMMNMTICGVPCPSIVHLQPPTLIVVLYKIK